jgi:hypothetical protein
LRVAVLGSSVGCQLDPGVGPANRRILKLRVLLDDPCLFNSEKFFVPHSGLSSLIDRKLREPLPRNA